MTGPTSAFQVGDRVTHRNLFPGGGPLPMRGTVVAHRVEVLVRWDTDEPSPLLIEGGPVAHSYDDAVLAPLEEDES